MNDAANVINDELDQSKNVSIAVKLIPKNINYIL